MYILSLVASVGVLCVLCFVEARVGSFKRAEGERSVRVWGGWVESAESGEIGRKIYTAGITVISYGF